jgi:curved DNA-binding protein CbpA
MTPKNCYELLEVASTASALGIKQAFRRVIAKYHPDKVQHLGVELQRIAAVRAAEITQAYRQLSTAVPGAGHDTPAELSELRSQGMGMSEDRDEVRGLVQRAALARFRDALREEGWTGEHVVAPFDVGATATAGWRQKGWKVLGRLVGELSDATVHETWTAARNVQRHDPRNVCVFLLGSSDSSPAQPGQAGSRSRMADVRSGEPALVLIRVDVSAWHADVPESTPPLMTGLLRRLSA